MKTPTETELRDLWLQKYHNTNTAEIIVKYPKEILESPKWFELYPCTQEQSDEWKKECKQLLNKKFKIPKYIVERSWPYVQLQLAPYVKHPLENISSKQYGEDGIGLTSDELTELLYK